jgi:hypothetical protein
MPASRLSFSELRADELASAGGGQVNWLWQGYLAPGNLTLLTSVWKSGKTTLLSVLLSRMRQGGTFAGQTLRPGEAFVVTEESSQLWWARNKKLGFGAVRFLFRPFRGRPTLPEWRELLDHIRGLHAQRAIDLVVIDTLARFYPGGSENEATGMTDALTPLAALASAGASVLVLHHPRRKNSPLGQAARGSGALMGFVDVLIEMRYVGSPASADRRRRLEALSRHDETPRDRVIELSADGTDYACLGDFEEAAFADGWAVLHTVLAGAARPLSVREVVKAWPPDSKPPAEQTLWRWLDRALGAGTLRREGAGRRNDPFRYFLPEMPERCEQRQEE